MNAAALNSPALLGSMRTAGYTSQCNFRFVLNSFKLVLFPSGVGFLGLRVEPESESLPDWQTLFTTLAICGAQTK